MDEIKETMLDILEEMTGEPMVKEDLDLNLLEEGLLDSLDYVTLQLEIEDRFGVLLPPSEYTKEELDTPRRIIDVIADKMAV
ncbi:MAG: D-alanine--poly(phosphoribitol) ligase subunit DltC [Anaerovoracaceae bacterium]